MIREIVIHSDALNLDMCKTVSITLHLEAIQPEPNSLRYYIERIKNADTGQTVDVSAADLSKIRAYVQHTAEQYALNTFDADDFQTDWRTARQEH